jgi:large subunit ribosomal protein L21
MGIAKKTSTKDTKEHEEEENGRFNQSATPPSPLLLFVRLVTFVDEFAGLDSPQAGSYSKLSPNNRAHKGTGNMYAVFEDGSRQYRVQEGDVVKVDYRDVQVGANIEFKRVLLAQKETDTKIGQPVIAGASVVGEVVDFPSTKVYIQHFKRRKNHRRFKGHRQPYTSVMIRQIVLPS